jgi:hypothetical protein
VRGKGQAAALLGCVALMGGLVGACGGDDSDSGGGGGSATSSGGTVTGAKTIDVNSMNGAKGNVTYCTGKDTSGAQKESVTLFNET